MSVALIAFWSSIKDFGVQRCREGLRTSEGKVERTAESLLKSQQSYLNSRGDHVRKTRLLRGNQSLCELVDRRERY